MNILKNGRLSNELSIFITKQGSKQLEDIDSKSLSDEKEIIESYMALRNYYIGQLAADKVCIVGKKKILERCELKNGQVYWLCPVHVKETNAKILTDSVKIQEANKDIDKYRMLEEIDNINLNDYGF